MDQPHDLERTELRSGGQVMHYAIAALVIILGLLAVALVTSKVNDQ